MANEAKNGLSESLETGAAAANTIRGAIKTGKAIAGAAKGAAAGGPYGAVAGALWANRKHLGKILCAIIILLLLPVLFILMLPGLIFGGLVNAFTPDDPTVPVINDSAYISEVAQDISFCVNGVLSEGLEDVYLRIDDDFSASGADGKEIIDPYAGNPVYNVNLFNSQYCAAKDQDFESISLADMERILQSAKSQLYSFTKKEELRTFTVYNEETGEDEQITERWIIYSIVYNGESYFADSIFQLSDEQKSLAGDYAQNLSLFLGDGMFQGLLPSEYQTLVALGDVRFTDGQTEVVYFNQLDEAYADKPYGTDNIGGYGCGPTAMSIVVSSLTNEIVDPVEMAEWAYKNGYWCKGSGSYHALIPAAAEAWHLPVEGCPASKPQRIADALSEGKLVVAIMGPGHFTSSGHFITLRGVEDGKILVADPASYKRSQQEWDLSVIVNETSKRAAAGGPFWIIG